MGQYPALPGRLFQDGGPGGSWGHEAHLHRVIGIYLDSPAEGLRTRSRAPPG